MRRVTLSVLAALLMLSMNAVPSLAASGPKTPPILVGSSKAYLVQAQRVGSTASPNVRVFNSMAEARAAVPQDNMVLGILWDNSPAGGASLTVYGPSCDQYGIGDLGPFGFDNLTSAVDNSCPYLDLYTGTNYTGTEDQNSNGRTDPVLMSNQSESVEFWLTFHCPPPPIGCF